MPEIHFDRYYRYDDLTTLLQAYAAEYPALVQVRSLGKSYEGRDIWLVTVTNSATGAAEDKPALWVDGNIHASEVSPSTACLYLLNQLTTQYGTADDITRALDTRTFYICPRVNPDGAEWALADTPKIIRSSTRPHPYDEEPLGGLTSEDVDGDGRMLFMRIADSNGTWKTHPDDPRLMIRRDPTEVGGQYYRLMREGFIKNYDGITIPIMPNKEGLDLNRNFPSGWKQENQQPGAGLYPASEPEVHAIVDFIARHKNITGAITFHTYSAVLLRPYSTEPDDNMPAEDLWTFQKIGDKGTQITGYPNVSVFHDFKYHPKEVIYGGFDDWVYEHLGAFAWTVEIWSPIQQAGIKDYKFIDWFREHPVGHDLMLLKWSDEQLGGKGYIDWYEFDHPQLGKIELGGWDNLYAWRNPPPEYLEKEVAPFTEWVVWHLLISPHLELVRAEAAPLGDGHYRVEVAVQNTGWLPTYVTKKALEKKVVRGVVAELTLPEGAELKTGIKRVDMGQLEGRAYAASSPAGFGFGSITADRARVEWTVQAQPGTAVQVRVHHPRAGVLNITLDLT
ncbi:MAG: M14 family metallopeptidase [Anaerolineae bacterium]